MRRFAGCLLAAIASTLAQTACIRPGLLEDRPPHDETVWRPLSSSEREAIRRRLADDKVLAADSELDAVRVPGTDRPYADWSSPWTFRGSEVHCEFRMIRYIGPPQPTDWPASFTVFRGALIDPEGLVWKDDGVRVLSAIGHIHYRWDLYVPDVLETRSCLFYERQLDRHERRHLLYAERLIRRLQAEGDDLLARLLGDRSGGASGAGASSVNPKEANPESSRSVRIAAEVDRFMADYAALRDRYWTAAEEEARVVKETFTITDSDRRDLQTNCLAAPPRP